MHFGSSCLFLSCTHRKFHDDKNANFLGIFHGGVDNKCIFRICKHGATENLKKVKFASEQNSTRFAAVSQNIPKMSISLALAGRCRWTHEMAFGVTLHLLFQPPQQLCQWPIVKFHNLKMFKGNIVGFMTWTLGASNDVRPSRWKFRQGSIHLLLMFPAESGKQLGCLDTFMLDRLTAVNVDKNESGVAHTLTQGEGGLTFSGSPRERLFVKLTPTNCC